VCCYWCGLLAEHRAGCEGVESLLALLPFLGAASSEDGCIRDDCVRPPTQSRLGLVRCLKCGGAGLTRTYSPATVDAGGTP
jgi:hypothetical protein